MRLFLVEWKKVIHQKLFWIIGVLLISYSLWCFVQIYKTYQRMGDCSIQKWESMKQNAEKFLETYNKESSKGKEMSREEREEVETYEKKIAFAEQMILNYQNGDWRSVVEEQLRLERERLNEMTPVYEEEVIREIQFQVAQYEYLLNYDIPIWKNKMQINGWNIIYKIMQAIIPWTVFGIGILSSITMSRERKTLTNLFVVPYGRGAVILSKFMVLITAGGIFLTVSVGIPALIAIVMNGMGSYNYPIQVGQRILQISGEKELAPLIICITAVFYNGMLFLSLVSAFSMFCSICLMDSKRSVGLVISVFILGTLLSNQCLSQEIIPVFGYGNSEFLLAGMWDFLTGMWIMLVLVLLFLMGCVALINKSEFCSKGGGSDYGIKC